MVGNPQWLRSSLTLWLQLWGLYKQFLFYTLSTCAKKCSPFTGFHEKSMHSPHWHFVHFSSIIFLFSFFPPFLFLSDFHLYSFLLCLRSSIFLHCICRANKFSIALVSKPAHTNLTFCSTEIKAFSVPGFTLLRSQLEI